MPGRVSQAFNARQVAATPGLKLLRAELMPVAVAILASHFEQRRTWLHSEFVTVVDEDLDELRAAGFEAARTAQEYISDWIRDGILIRRPTASREETVELSRSASDVLRFVDEIERPRSRVTSSRLSNVADLLAVLARDSDPLPATRLESLLAERAALDAEIARVEAGDFQPVSSDLARERLQEILRLAAEVPGDFAKVAFDLEQLNHSLREQIINNDGSRGGVLDEVFAGVDMIESSDAGRTFNAFYALLLDPRLVDAFDQAVDAVLSRDFTSELDVRDAHFLRNYLTGLQTESSQVRESLTGFSRSLRRFVETQEYREHKRLADALSRAEQAGMQAMARVAPTRQIGRAIDLTSVTISSIGGWRLHNPANVRTPSEVSEHDSAELDLAALLQVVRLTEIDFDELQGNIDQALQERTTATVGEVLEMFPASQGLASVVGLLFLATRFAVPAAGEEQWSWTSASGASRTVSAPRYVFARSANLWRQP